MPNLLYDLFGKGKIGFLMAMILGSLFCLTLGILSIFENRSSTRETSGIGFRRKIALLISLG